MVGRPRVDPEQKQDFGDRTVTQGLDTQRPIPEALQSRFAGLGVLIVPPVRALREHLDGAQEAVTANDTGNLLLGTVDHDSNVA